MEYNKRPTPNSQLPTSATKPLVVIVGPTGSGKSALALDVAVKFNSQLDQFKRRALDKVVNDAYVKRLAEREGVSVSDREVDDQIAIARSQQRFGATEQSLEDVISDYWGWSLDDFKRTLRQQLLVQKVVEKLDTETRQKAELALSELESGTDFADVASKHSEDEATAQNGGEFGFAIDKMSRELSPQSADALFELNEGAYTQIINTGYSLEIIRNIETNDNKIRAAHIVFNFEPIETYINNLKDQQPFTVYIQPPEAPVIQNPEDINAPTP
jgi:adenylate kinase family enzyme